MRVLLIEDSSLIRDRLRAMIEAAFDAVSIAESGTVARAQLLFYELAPDAVVLDLQLSDDTGYRLIEEFKCSRPGCIVMVLTHSTMLELRARCMALGADYFFNKSSEFERVVSVLVAMRGELSTDRHAWHDAPPVGVKGPESLQAGEVPAATPAPTTATSHDSESQWRALISLAVDWYWQQDTEFRFVRITGNGHDHGGATAAQHIGKTRWELPHVGITELAWHRHREQLNRHETFRDFEITRPGPDGALHSISVSGIATFDASGRFTGYRGVSRDITAQRAAEATLRTLQTQLHDAQRFEALGTLAGGIAHDFNNVIGAVLGNVALAREDINTGNTALERLGQIESIARGARALTQQILSFSDRQPQVRLNHSLALLVEDTVTLLRSMLPRTALLHIKLPASELQVTGDATQLRQVLMNLCINAAHALSESGGEIEIGLREIVLDHTPAGVVGDLRAGHYAHLWVSDNGHGMDEHTQARIFQSFFTTKKQGHGTGLGMTIVRNVLNRHGGAIGIKSAPQQGSTFDVYLPAVTPAKHGQVTDTWFGADCDMPNHQVLVVDDDPVMASIMTKLLERMGLRVTHCSDPAQALATLASMPQVFKLVVTDFNMNGMSGLELARSMAANHPEVKVMMATGFVDDSLREQARDVGLHALLKKENLAQHLRAMVAKLLAIAPANGWPADHAMLEA